jgi:hypothetical protein
VAEAIQHPAATEHLPSFITGPGETDVLMVVMAAILLLSILGFGIVFLRLHTLPERLAHRRHKLQFEIVAVLGLIALFTHMHIFWVAGLLLALIDLPDFSTPLNRIAGSAEKMAGLKPGDGDSDLAETSAGEKQAGEKIEAGQDTSAVIEHGDRGPTKAKRAPPSRKELSHA